MPSGYIHTTTGSFSLVRWTGVWILVVRQCSLTGVLRREHAPSAVSPTFAKIATVSQRERDPNRVLNELSDSRRRHCASHFFHRSSSAQAGLHSGKRGRGAKNDNALTILGRENLGVRPDCLFHALNEIERVAVALEGVGVRLTVRGEAERAEETFGWIGQLQLLPDFGVASANVDPEDGGVSHLLLDSSKEKVSPVATEANYEDARLDGAYRDVPATSERMQTQLATVDNGREFAVRRNSPR